MVCAILLAASMLPAPALAAEPPPPELKVLVRGARLDGPSLSTLEVTPGQTVELRAKVMGGQRAWCMDPSAYKRIGPNTTVTHHGLSTCGYEVQSDAYHGIGEWSVTSESYSWTTSGGVLTPAGDGETATWVAPGKPGTARIDVTGSVSWHLDSRTVGAGSRTRDLTDGPVSASVTVTVAGTPTRLTPAQAKDLLLQQFFKRIPAGPAQTQFLAHLGSPGFANNTKSLVGYDEYDEFSCGGYQGKVLDLLNGLRESNNPDERAIFDHWEFGPIQAYYGGHQAVVIYPKGGAWKTGGLVLDPWPNQRPETFTMAAWQDRFSFGVGTSGVYKGQYPLTGGTDYPERSVRPTPEQRAALRRLPREQQRAFLAMEPWEKEAYLATLTREDKARVGVAVHSPVKLLVGNRAGQRVGFLPSGEFVYEIPGTDVDLFPEPDGSRGAAYFLPFDTYRVDVIGGARGTAGLTWAVPTFAAGPPVSHYDGISVEPGGTLKLTLDPNQAERPTFWGPNQTPVPPTEVDVGVPSLPSCGCAGVAPLGVLPLGGALLALWCRRRRR